MNLTYHYRNSTLWAAPNSFASSKEREEKKTLPKPCSYTLTSVCILSILVSIHFLRCWQGEFVYQSREYLVCDHFFYSHNLTMWCKVYTAGRNYILVTLKDLRVKAPLPGYRDRHRQLVILANRLRVVSQQVDKVLCQVFDPFYPNINTYILQTVLYTFPKVLTRRICLTIKRFLT